MPPTLGEIFESAIQLEEFAQAVYERWRTCFSDHPFLSAFWQEYAEDEKRHALLLEKTRAGLEPERLVQPADPQVVEGVRSARALLNRLPHEVETLSDALEWADEVEHSEINSVLEFLVTHFSSDATAQKMVQMQMREHIERLNVRSPLQTLGKTALTIKAVR